MKRHITRAALILPLIIFSVMVGFAQDERGPQAISANSISCPMTLPEGDVDGETMVCGQIEVPENWDNPSGRTIVITYAIAKAVNEAPFADPIMYFEGGPGISALEEIEALAYYTQRLRQTRDLIFFDQRGIRYSSNLECPPEVKNQEVPFELPEGTDLEALQATLENVSLDSDPDQLLEANRIQNAAGVGKEALNCAPYFAAQGIDLDQYGTYQNVLDAIALMGALEYSSYNLYGISYGSNHTQEVMRYYDENPSAALPAIRSIVIDGVIPISADWAVNSALGGPSTTLNVLEACEADAICSAHYPNIRQRTIDLLVSLQEVPLVIGDTTISLQDLRVVLGSGSSNPRADIYLPRLIDELERGETLVYSRLVDGTLPAESADQPHLGNPLDAISQGASDVAGQLRTIADQMEKLAAESQRLSEAYQSGIALPALFAEEFADSAEQLSDVPRAQLRAFLQQVSFVPSDRQTLINQVNLMPEIDRNLLLSLLNTMSDEDVAQVFSILSDPIYAERLFLSFSISQTVIHCNDRVFDLHRTFEILRAYEVPQLIDVSYIDVQMGLNCENYGLKVTEIPPLVSNTSGFPVLISNGSLDQNTTIIWGKAVYENLQNARLVTFPQSKHGATMESQCAMDITNAFFMYPEAELNTTCIETLRPVFVLPDDELPPPPNE